MASISLLGKKIGMTQIFDLKGNAIPVTVLKVGPCWITEIKTKAYHGYDAIQIGYLKISPTKKSKAEVGHLSKNKLPTLRYLHEYRYNSKQKFKVGEILSTKNLYIQNRINVKGMTIGKGFSGYQKRHHFTRGPISHGSKNHRKPGSIGAGTTPGRVFPGQKMAGQMGGSIKTIRNLEIIKIIEKDDLILVKGAVPGKAGNIITVSQS